MSELKSTYEMVLDGLRAIRRQHDELETGKAGSLRAGNTGVVLTDGSVVGKCARLTYLRLIGVDAGDDDASRELMFGAGVSNEDRWYDKLVRGGFPAERIRRETEIPIRWQTQSGRWVTGRPDIVLMSEVRGQTAAGPVQHPQRLIELKQVSSLWTARDVLFGKPVTQKRRDPVPPMPKTMHLLQAAHYAWQLACPGELWYTSRTDFHAAYSGWPVKGAPGSEFMAYDEYSKPLKVLPFLVGYALDWRGGDLYFRRMAAGSTPPGEWTRSLVTKQGIVDYYELVDTLALPGVEGLPPRPDNLYADGEVMEKSACFYCPLLQVCNKVERRGKTIWVEEAKRFLALTPATGSVRLDTGE
jgi:hypothetical protein